MKHLSRYDIAILIEQLPGNEPWSAPSMATTSYDAYTRPELVDWYNSLIDDRSLNIPHIS